MNKIGPDFLSLRAGSLKLINGFPLSQYSCVSISVIRANFFVVSTVVESACKCLLSGRVSTEKVLQNRRKSPMNIGTMEF